MNLRTRHGKKKIIFVNDRSVDRIVNPKRPDCVMCVIEDEAGGWREEWIRPQNIVKDKEQGAH